MTDQLRLNVIYTKQLVCKLVLQLLRWRCVECVLHHERNVREERHHIYVARTSNNRVIPME